MSATIGSDSAKEQWMQGGLQEIRDFVTGNPNEMFPKEQSVSQDRTNSEFGETLRTGGDT